MHTIVCNLHGVIKGIKSAQSSFDCANKDTCFSDCQTFLVDVEKVILKE